MSPAGSEGSVVWGFLSLEWLEVPGLEHKLLLSWVLSPQTLQLNQHEPSSQTCCSNEVNPSPASRTEFGRATCGSEVRKEVTVTFRVVLCMFQEYPAQPAWLKLAEDFSAQARELCDDVDSPRSRNRLVCFDCNMQQFFFHVCLIHPAWLGRSIKRQESLMLFRDYQKLHVKWKENKPVSTAKKPLELGRGVLSRPGEMRILKMQFLRHLSSSFLRVSFS